MKPPNEIQIILAVCLVPFGVGLVCAEQYIAAGVMLFFATTSLLYNSVFHEQ